MTSLAEISSALNARIDQINAELNDIRRQLAVVESLVCQCRPEREDNDRTRTADYLHAADCIVTAARQTACTK